MFSTVRAIRLILFPLLCFSAAAETLYNGIVLPPVWPPDVQATQLYTPPTYITNPPAVIPIDLGRQLFVDDFLIASTTLTRREHRPVMHPGNPVFAPDGVADPTAAIPFSDGVWFDPSDGLFKMWYFGATGSTVSYATSTDGIQWTRPALPGGPFPGTNRLTQLRGGRDSTTVWFDQEETNPARRFKLFYYYPDTVNDPSIFYRFSPDGILWGPDEPHRFSSISDRTTLFWNPFRKRWVESIRSRWALPDAPTRPGYFSRARLYSESADLINWTPITFWTSPDVQDPIYGGGTNSPPELYNLDAVAYESVILGLFSWYHPGPPGETNKQGPNLVELTAGFSRDGFQWVRPTRGYGPTAFIPASNTPGTWNAYNTQSVGGCMLVVGEELWFYFSGRTAQKPANGIMSTGLAKLRRDGFYSMDAGTAEGTLTTRRVSFSRRRLFVNVDSAGGELRAEVLDTNGNVISPFSKGNSIPARINTTLHEMKWNGATDMAALAGRTVQFRFYLRNGSLYSFWVSPDASGASGGYVAAGGPGYDSAKDTAGLWRCSPPPRRPWPRRRGTFSQPVQVQLTTGTAGAEIRYTVNGADPTEASTLYTAPFTVSKSSTVRARAYKTGLAPSPVSGAYLSFKPANSGLTPTSGSGASGLFVARFQDPDGFADLDVMNVLINRGLDGRSACYVAYSRTDNVLYLVNDAGSGLLPGLIMNGSGSVSNSFCTLLGAGSSAVGTGNTLTLTLNIAFNQTTFASSHILYIAARDRDGGNTGWSTSGVWTVPPATAPSIRVLGFSPTAGASAAVTISAVFRHPAGASAITNSQFLINTDLNGNNACYIGYLASANQLFLVKDTGPGLDLHGPIAPDGGSGVMENSQCRVTSAGSSVTRTGTDLRMTVRVLFKPGFSGLKLLYAAAQNFDANPLENTGWLPLGLWTVP
ncbi:MAG: chitobiase/beta-hexosaminidase C-terminal domain-containing protein [Bryobacteraceae bacterium]